MCGKMWTVNEIIGLDGLSRVLRFLSQFFSVVSFSFSFVARLILHLLSVVLNCALYPLLADIELQSRNDNPEGIKSSPTKEE